MMVRSDLGIYNNVAVTARYKRRCTGSLKPALFSAVATVIAQHPILSAIPVDTDTSSPYFAQLPSIDLDQVVQFHRMASCGDEYGRSWALDRFLQGQHNHAFQYTKPPTPFWRLHVMEEGSDSSHFALSFVFHHCIADTKSALAFHEAIEAALATPGEPNADRTIRAPNMALLPPVDAFLDRDTSTSPSTPQEQPPTTWTGAVQFTPVRTKFRSLWLSAATTKQLVDVTKQQRISLTAALQTMLAAAVFRRLPPAYTAIKVDCPLSLRSWLPPPVTATSMGCFIDSFSETYHRGPFTWDEARRTKETIARVVRQRRGDGLCGNLRRIPDLRTWFENKMGTARPSALELSNVGRLGSSANTESSNYEIESLLFSQSAGACSGAIKVSAVTGRNGRLTLGFSWQDGVVRDGMVESVIHDLESILQETLHKHQRSIE